MQTNYVERPQGKIAYTEYRPADERNNGELVLMLPGMGALRSEYRFLAPALADAGYLAISADLRGHGESSAFWDRYDVPSVGEDILAMIDHFDAGPAHLITTSFSPGAAVWAAAERPESVRSLVLIGAFVRDAKINPLMQSIFWLMLNNPWRVKTWGMFYRSLYPTRKPDDFEEYLARLVANLAEPGRFDAAKRLSESSRKPSEERLARVKVPVLVVMGTKDPDFPDPVGEANYIAQQTNGQVALIEGAGHYPQTEMPEKTTPIILDFLKQA